MGPIARADNPTKRRLRGRSGFPSWLVLIAAAIFSSCAEERAPHVLFVTIDTLRADHLGAYGYERDTSPNFDALAEESVLFERAYSHAPFTAPSHASLFTSLHPPSHGVHYWGLELPEELDDFGGIYARSGYRTGAFYNHPGLQGTNLTRRFDEVQLRWFEPAEATVDGYFEWLDRDDRSSAAWVHLWDAHRPYGYRDWRAEHFKGHVDRDPMWLSFEEQRYNDEWDPKVGRQEAFYNLNETRLAKPKQTQRGERLLIDRDLEFISDRYDGGVHYADAGLGLLVDGLRERGLLDNTILVVTSDHGESLLERSSCLFTHDPFLHEETLHIPLLIRLPGQVHGGVRHGSVVRAIDILPTLLEASDLPLPASFQGKSLMPAMAGEPSSEALAFAQTQTRHAKERVASDENGWLEERQTVFDGRYRYIEDLELGTHYLFDVQSDPGESVNLAGIPEHEDTLASLQKALTFYRSLPIPAEVNNSNSETLEALLNAAGYIGKDE